MVKMWSVASAGELAKVDVNARPSSKTWRTTDHFSLLLKVHIAELSTFNFVSVSLRDVGARVGVVPRMPCGQGWGEPEQTPAGSGQRYRL